MDSVTVQDVVFDRGHVPRWMVLATFVGVNGEPRCVDYRVRVIPETAPGGRMGAIGRLTAVLESQSISAEDVASLGTVPPEGIPRYVFEKASQSRLLEKARRLSERELPGLDEGKQRIGAVEVDEEAQQLLSRQLKPRRGRPPARSLRERLLILGDIETAFAEGRTLQQVADKHHISRSAVRDLLAWARSSDSGEQLFEGTTPGRSGGRLTPRGRALLDQVTGED